MALAVPITKMDLRNIFTRSINNASAYVIIRIKDEIGTSFHYIPREGREAFQEYYEQHYWVTPDSDTRLIDIRPGKTSEITGIAQGSVTAINSIW